MSGFIARQPNGLICRHSTVVDCVTDYNMTERDYINLCKGKGIVEAEAQDILENYMRDFSWVRDYFCPNNMTEEEFQQILQEMELPKEQCIHRKT